MDKFNNQFATQKLRQEMSVTSAGATFTPGTGEQMASNKAFKKKTKKEVKDVEPKYAAGKAKIYPKEKWGWKEAPSVPNRPSKGGFIYKQLFEELSEFVNEIDRNDPILMAMRAQKDAPKPQAPQAKKANPNQAKINMLLKKRAEIERDMEQEAEPEGGPIADKYGDMLNKIDQAIRKLKGQGDWGPETNPYMDKGEIERRAKMMNEAIHIGTDTKTDSDIYFEPKTGAFYINIIDPAGNRTNKLQVNTIEDVLAKFPNWKWTKEGEIEFQPEEQDDDEDSYDWFTDKYEPVSDYGRHRQDPDYYEKDYQEKGTSDYFQRRGLDENYSRFKNETKTRGKSDQFHQAVRQVKKKVQEINRLFEYVSRLKMELSEGEDGLKYKMHTEKALEKIKEMVSVLNKNIRKFK